MSEKHDSAMKGTELEAAESALDHTASLSPSERASRASSAQTPARESVLRRVVSGDAVAPAAIDDTGLIGGNPDRYEYTGEQGRGGLGRVVKARDRSLGRQVAIKELLRDSKSAEARFVREAMVTARLEHPGVVPVHEAGRWPSGEPYYVMKLISGRTLKDLARSPESLDHRLALLPKVIAVADAVAYAHSQGVIHRDLKPSNVVVGEFGETVVIDWGLAKDLLRPADEDRFVGESSISGEQTAVGDVLGTPAYMPPEQARGDDVDERADIYALGAMLYEVLGGKSPYAGVESGKIIAHVLEGGPEPLERLWPEVPPDLLAIVEKATAREPADRYRTAKELADDLRRYQTGQLVTAHSYSTAALARRWLWRHRAVVSVAAVFLAVLAVLGTVSVRRIIRERNFAEAERERAERRGHQLVFHHAENALERDPTAAVAWLKTYPASGPAWPAVPGMLDEARSKGVARHVLGHGGWVRGVAFAPDGKRLASASLDGSIRLWDVKTGRAEVVGRVEHGAVGVAFSHDGNYLASSGLTGEIDVWNLTTGTKRELSWRHSDVYMLFFSRDDTRLYGVGDKVMMNAWSVADGTPIASYGGDDVGAAAARDGSVVVTTNSEGDLFALDGDFAERRLITRLPSRARRGNVSDDGRLTAVQCEDEVVRLVDVATGKIRDLGRREGRVDSVVFSHDGRRLATAGDDGVARVWDLSTGEIQELRGHEDAIYMAAFSPDGSALVTAGDDATARVWNLDTGDVHVLRGHEDDVVAVAFSPDGTLLATASLDNTVRLWPLRFNDARVLLGGDAQTRALHRAGVGRTPPGAIGYLALIDEGRRAITVGQQGELRLWDLASGKSRTIGQSAIRYTLVPYRPPVSPDGRFIAVPGEDNEVDLWEVETGEHFALRAHEGRPVTLAFSPDSRSLLSGGMDGRLLLWDLASRTPTELTHKDEIFAATYSPDGKRVALFTRQEVGIWDLATNTKTRSLDRMEGDEMVEGPVQISYSPDGRWLLVAGWRFGYTVWNLETGEKRELERPPFHAVDQAFSTDGRWLAMAAGNRTVHLWDLQSGHRRILRGHTDLIISLRFSPDGRTLATSSYDKTIRLWDVKSGTARVLRGHAASVDAIAWQPDGSELVSAGRDGTVRVWPVADERPRSPEEVRAHMGELTTAVISAEDRPLTPEREIARTRPQ